MSGKSAFSRTGGGSRDVEPGCLRLYSAQCPLHSTVPWHLCKHSN
jgi:hypothetical protein